MKKINIILSILCFMALSCQRVPEVPFDVDVREMEIGPDGGTRTFSIKSPTGWIATTEAPWIAISPANGTSSSECTIVVDSSLTFTSREDIVKIKLGESGEYKEFTVKQAGYDHSISLKEQKVEIPEYADYGSRGFDIPVKTNVDFEVVVPEGVTWITAKKPSADFDRGARPRNVLVHFDWTINSRPSVKEAEITFKPKTDEPLVRNDVLKVVQSAAREIEGGTPKGDSLALLSIARVLNVWNQWDPSEKMEHWDGVQVWKSGKDKGRVRSAQFFLFSTKEGLPYQVRYLDAIEELYFYSNENSFLYSLSTGADLCTLKSLRKLTIGAYGLTELPESFTNLENLEYLDLSGNNFEEIPPVLTEEHFPKLTALIINANQRHVAGDLYNNYKENCGGLIKECPLDADGKREFPRRLLKWNKLDTLRLSVNYLQGTIPDFSDEPSFPRWTAEEVNACDTLPSILIGLPKVLPETDFFAINLNRLHGELPQWLLYHPKLDLWYPDLLVFNQEGKDQDGNLAGFSNAPSNLNYYYEQYTNKKYNPNNISAE